MSSIDLLPPERDIPADRHARMRSRLLSAITEPGDRGRRVRRRRPVRIAVAGLAMVAGAAVVWAAGPYESSRPSAVYAIGDGVLSPGTRDAARQCLTLASRDDGMGALATWPANAPPTVLNYIERPGRGAIVIFETQSTLIYCVIGPAVQDGPEPREFTTDGSQGGALAVLDSSQWLPGPISLETARSTDLQGGYIDAAGRVGARVARVVLDDGAGRQSTARLAGGTFVVFSDGRTDPGAGVLISYDSSGAEIDRRPAAEQPAGRCYTDPAGKLVNPISNDRFDMAYKSKQGRCDHAEPWSRRNSTQSTPQ
jgi:hypothetical protein